jgi:hypothetical protein
MIVLDSPSRNSELSDDIERRRTCGDSVSNNLPERVFVQRHRQHHARDEIDAVR